MVEKKIAFEILGVALILTVTIFVSAILFNYGLDFYRFDSILQTIVNHEIDSDAYHAEINFIDVFGGNKCEVMQRRIRKLKDEIHQVGIELTTYGTLSLFKKKDFNYLKRRYFLLEIKFYALINQMNIVCDKVTIPILFFYEIDDEDSETQGFVLDNIGRSFESSVVVLSIDKDYEDEQLVALLVKKYNITSAPTMVINNNLVLTGLIFEGPLNNSITKIFSEADPYGKNYNFNFTLNAVGMNITKFLSQTKKLLSENISDFAKGDISLMLGRITGDERYICNASIYFDKAALFQDPEENATIYETIASIGCGRNKRAYLLEAAKLWRKLGVPWRADIDERLAYGERDITVASSLEPFTVNASFPSEFSSMTIGTSNIFLNEKDILVSQVDRVNRDWLSYQLFFSPFHHRQSDELITSFELNRSKLLTTFSERLTYDNNLLQPEVGWHEGARIQEMREINFSHWTASNTLVKKINGSWFAPDEKGTFRFEVPIDKILYPSTRFLREDLALIIDTHGVNMLVEQAIRKNATVVVGCCDHPGKINAALYLHNKGIQTICFTDKYLPLALGSGAEILGSPPIAVYGGLVELGNRPLTIQNQDKIIVMTVNSTKFAISYYDTPARYFKNLENYFELNVTYVTVTDYDQMENVINVAEQNDAHIIAVRVFGKSDYDPVRIWLEKDPGHKAILFHSAAYPFGYRLFKEFPLQTTFDDINPVFT